MAFPKWYNVNKNIRVWAGHSDGHKQGWIFAPAAIQALEEYKGSYRFEECRSVDDGKCDFEADPGYPDLWVRADEVSEEPYNPDPDPDPVISNEEAGTALRTIVNFILILIRGK